MVAAHVRYGSILCHFYPDVDPTSQANQLAQREQCHPHWWPCNRRLSFVEPACDHPPHISDRPRIQVLEKSRKMVVNTKLEGIKLLVYTVIVMIVHTQTHARYLDVKV